MLDNGATVPFCEWRYRRYCLQFVALRRLSRAPVVPLGGGEVMSRRPTVAQLDAALPPLDVNDEEAACPVLRGLPCLYAAPTPRFDKAMRKLFAGDDCPG